MKQCYAVSYYAKNESPDCITGLFRRVCSADRRMYGGYCADESWGRRKSDGECILYKDRNGFMTNAEKGLFLTVRGNTGVECLQGT